MAIDEEPLETRIIEFAQLLLPIGLLATLLIANTINTPLTPHTALRIPFFMMAIYYWALFHPLLIPGWVAFCAGIIIDLFTLAPLGLSALIFTGLQKLLITQRHYIINQPFWIIWLIFTLLYALTVAFSSLFYSGMFFTVLTDVKITAAIALNALAFPPIYYLLHLSYKVMIRPPPSPLERGRRRKIILKKTRHKKGGLSA